jgi:hypothetical protein
MKMQGKKPLLWGFNLGQVNWPPKKKKGVRIHLWVAYNKVRGHL